jgi:hypothetical protein
MKKSTTIFLLSAFFILSFTSCGIYSFTPKGTLPDSLKTVRVQIFENHAPYVNPQLSPNLTDRIRQKITRQTKLTQTNSDNANLDISGTITDYSVLTTGVASVNGQKQTSVNRLTITVHVVFNNTLSNDVKEADVSHSFDFSANQSLQQAESQLLDEMVRNLSDEIFNRIFSDW